MFNSIVKRVHFEGLTSSMHCSIISFWILVKGYTLCQLHMALCFLSIYQWRDGGRKLQQWCHVCSLFNVLVICPMWEIYLYIHTYYIYTYIHIYIHMIYIHTFIYTSLLLGLAFFMCELMEIWKFRIVGLCTFYWC